jgi:hypothetical protein
MSILLFLCIYALAGISLNVVVFPNPRGLRLRQRPGGSATWPRRVVCLIPLPELPRADQGSLAIHRGNTVLDEVLAFYEKTKSLLLFSNIFLLLYLFLSLFFIDFTDSSKTRVLKDNTIIINPNLIIISDFFKSTLYFSINTFVGSG